MGSFSSKKSFQSGAADISLLLSIGFLFFMISGAVVYFLVFGNPPLNTAKIVENTIAVAAKTTSYAVKIQIEPSPESFIQKTFVGQVIYDITGKKANGVFDVPSFAGAEKPVSRIETLLSGNTAFTRFVPRDVSPKDLFVFPKEWFRVDPSDKPDEFRVVEQSFALTDFLKILTGGSGYIMTQNGAVKEDLNGAKTYHITFRRQEKFPEGLPQENAQLFSALSDKDDINVWVDEKTYEVLEMRFVINGFGIIAVISDLNKVITITEPLDVITYSDWKNKVFSASVSNLTPITQISIGSYGEIKPAYLEGIRQAIQKATGITPTVLKSAPVPEKIAPIYDGTRLQWNEKAMLSGVELASSSFGPSVRILYVINDPMFSPFEKEKPSLWVSGAFGANAAIISLAGLDQAVGQSTSTPTEATVVLRTQKVALYALGKSIGFDLSPSAASNKCVMYAATSIAELDSEDASYCPQEKLYIPQIFKIK